MMAENVVIPEAFAARIDKAALEELKDAGASSSNPLPIDKLDLSGPGYGEIVLGTLTDAECALFVEYHEVMDSLDTFHREATATAMNTLADAVREKKEQSVLSAPPTNTVPDELLKKMAHAQRKAEYLKHLLYFHLCEKYNCHEYAVGIRAGRKFVRGKKRGGVE